MHQMASQRVFCQATLAITPLSSMLGDDETKAPAHRHMSQCHPDSIAGLLVACSPSSCSGGPDSLLLADPHHVSSTRREAEDRV